MVFDPEIFTINSTEPGHDLEVVERDELGVRQPQQVLQKEYMVIKKDLGSTRRAIRPISNPKTFSPAKSRADLTENFVALEKLRRLVLIRVLHQLCLRELQRLRSSGIS